MIKIKRYIGKNHSARRHKIWNFLLLWFLHAKAFLYEFQSLGLRVEMSWSSQIAPPSQLDECDAPAPVVEACPYNGTEVDRWIELVETTDHGLVPGITNINASSGKPGNFPLGLLGFGSAGWFFYSISCQKLARQICYYEANNQAVVEQTIVGPWTLFNENNISVPSQADKFRLLNTTTTGLFNTSNGLRTYRVLESYKDASVGCVPKVRPNALCSSGSPPILQIWKNYY